MLGKRDKTITTTITTISATAKAITATNLIIRATETTITWIAILTKSTKRTLPSTDKFYAILSLCTLWIWETKMPGRDIKWKQI